MANNRIYLRCRACGETLYLGKTYLCGFFYMDYDDSSLVRKLNDFYLKHNYCGRQKIKELLPYSEEEFPLPEDCDGYDGSFDIVYESIWGTGYEPKEEN